MNDVAIKLGLANVAVAFIIVDPAHLALRLANIELDAWRAIEMSGATPRIPAFLMTQAAFLAPAGAALPWLAKPRKLTSGHDDRSPAWSPTGSPWRRA